MVTKEKWAQAIKDFHEKWIPRFIERGLDVPVEMPIRRATTIIGPRRAGKTYLMYQIISRLAQKIRRQQILYVNLEKADLGEMTLSDMVKMAEAFHELYPDIRNEDTFIFLDEIQNVPGWERFVRTILDEGAKVFLSGSSSKLLSSEIATSMRGRSITYRLFTFSFSEYMRSKGMQVQKYFSTQEKAKMLGLLANYVEYGGYPEAALYEQERERILTEILETTIYKDVIERAKIRNTKALKILVSALANSLEFSAHKFHKYLKSNGMKISKTAIYSYIQHLNDAFIIFPLKKFSRTYKESEQSIPKIYFSDNGLLRIHGITDKGRLMENLVFTELLRRNKKCAYYRSASGEVDFVLLNGNVPEQLIQVSYSTQGFGTHERETKALIKASRELKTKKMSIITWEEEKEEQTEAGTIKYIPLWKWLLGEGKK